MIADHTAYDVQYTGNNY